MAIVFDNLEKIMSDRGIKKSDLRGSGKDGRLHPSVISKVFSGKNINIETVNTLCALLDCQPSDIMEYQRSEDDPTPLEKKS